MVRQAEAVIDLDAYRGNVELLARRVRGSAVMAVVKANAYGHGTGPIARAAREAGADWLGVATIDEALALRAMGDDGPVLCWMSVPGSDFSAAVDAGVEVTASHTQQLEEIVAAAQGRRIRVQLKIDTGLSRNGSSREEWPRLVNAAVNARDTVDITGIWSHLACADTPAHPANDLQQSAFDEAVAYARDAGLEPDLVHLANSAATVTRPQAAYDLVRVGIASYGLSPAPAVDPTFGLRPVMTLRAPLAHVKRVHAGTGVSYGHTWVADRDTTLGLVPIGYGDGILRSASNRGVVSVNRVRSPLRGAICMDQMVVDLGDRQARPGDMAVLFGPGDDGEPTAQEWADAAATISYEVVTRLGGRIERTYIGA